MRQLVGLRRVPHGRILNRPAGRGRRLVDVRAHCSAARAASGFRVRYAGTRRIGASPFHLMPDDAPLFTNTASCAARLASFLRSARSMEGMTMRLLAWLRSKRV